MYRRAGIACSLWLAILCCISCRQAEEDDGGDPISAFERQDLDKEWVKAAAGPWGALEYRRFYLPLPKAWLDHSMVSDKAVWQIPNITPAKLQEIMAATPLNEQERRLWLETCQLQATPTGVSIHPSKEFRWELTAKSRTMLYAWLGQFPENESLAMPFCYQASDLNEWLQDSNLSEDLVQNIRQLLYRIGDSVCFADLDLIEDKVKDREERATLLGVLYRHPYCEVRLRLDQKSDIKALSTYWGEWHRVERVKRKLKETLGNQPEAHIALANLIPPHPRSVLNTFPALPKSPTEFQPDCYWTAFNFFNRTPDNRFADNAFMEEALVKYHDRVEGKPRYGDLIFLVDASGRPLHGAVYLADDLIFTKNGGHFTQPWVIMKLADMKACYPQPTPLRETYYRWNPQKTRPNSS
jgi:hypothetical protein